MSEITTYEELEEAEERPFNKTLFFRMLSYMKRYKRETTLVGLGIVLAAGVPLFEPYLLGQVVDQGIIGKDVAAIKRLALILMSLHLLGWVGNLVPRLFEGESPFPEEMWIELTGAGEVLYQD